VVLRFFHITLAMLLFASSAGANLSIHYCGGKITKWALFVKSDNCGMPQVIDQAQTSESDGDTPQIKRTPCCQDELSYHKLDVEQPTLDADDSDILQSELLAVAKITSTLATSKPASFPFSSPFVGLRLIHFSYVSALPS